MDFAEKTSYSYEISCYIAAMSRHSAKSAGRSSKTARTSAKKTTKAATKSVRGSVKTATKSARQPVGKAPSKTSAKRASTKSAAAKSAVTKSVVTKSAVKAAAKAAPARKPAPKPIHTETPLAPTVPGMFHTFSPPVQPIVVPEVTVRAHKYDVGDTVYYTSPSFGRAAASGSYTVVKLLPSDGEDYQYRIKSSGEAFERVAKESQLDRA